MASLAVTTGSGAAERAPRLAALDVVRGVAILAMIVYHFGWDLSAFGLIAVDVSVDTAWRVFARLIAGTFLALVGINLVLASRHGFRLRPYLRRLIVIIAAAALVSLGTWWLMPDTFVFFGILHSIAVASVLALPFLRAPAWVTALAALLFIIAPRFLADPMFDSSGWYWLGLSTDPPPTVDYVPVFPWFGIVLFGVAAGRMLLRDDRNAIWRWQDDSRVTRFLSVAGRWSLPIYLIHQPVLIGILIAVQPLFGPSKTALAGQLTSEYEAACAVEGYGVEACADYGRCILAGLSAEDGMLLAASRHQLTEEQVARWQITVAECRARILPPAVADGI